MESKWVISCVQFHSACKIYACAMTLLLHVNIHWEDEQSNLTVVNFVLLKTLPDTKPIVVQREHWSLNLLIVLNDFFVYQRGSVNLLALRKLFGTSATLKTTDVSLCKKIRISTQDSQRRPPDIGKISKPFQLGTSPWHLIRPSMFSSISQIVYFSKKNDKHESLAMFLL